MFYDCDQSVNAYTIKVPVTVAEVQVGKAEEEVKEEDCSLKTFQGIKLVNARFVSPYKDYSRPVHWYHNMDCPKGLPASNAIDGSVCINKCGAHSDRSNRAPLMIDLETPTTIDYIILYGRQDTNAGYKENIYANAEIIA